MKAKEVKKYYIVLNTQSPFNYLCGNTVTDNRSRRQMFASREAAQEALMKVTRFLSESQIREALIVGD